MSRIARFRFSSQDYIYSVNPKPTLNSKSKFDEQLQSKWNEARSNGCFRYFLDELEANIISGKHSFLTQLNVKRAEERRKPEFISSITEPFNPNKFNFNKIKDNEILFYLENTDNGSEKQDEDALIINVSPLEYGHSLLVSSISSCHPQIILHKGLKLATEMILLSATPCLRVAFNSLGAYASVNHHHLHLYYLKYNLPLETKKVHHLSGNCYEIKDYPAPGFAFELVDKNIDELVSSVMILANFCLSKGIPHNLFITKGKSFNSDCTFTDTYDTVRVFFWARKAVYGSKDDYGFNAAACELAGHVPIKVQSMFGSLEENDICQVLHNFCHEIFTDMKDEVIKLFA